MHKMCVLFLQDSPFVYIAGKARAASALRASGVASYAPGAAIGHLAAAAHSSFRV